AVLHHQPGHTFRVPDRQPVADRSAIVLNVERVLLQPNLFRRTSSSPRRSCAGSAVAGCARPGLHQRPSVTPFSPGSFLDHDCGSLISIPYLGATASRFSISSVVGGRAVVEPSGSGTPNSKNIISSPAGATERSILAGLLLSFLKE